MESNFLITDMFTSFEKFATIAKALNKKMRADKVNEGRFEAAFSIVRRDINELFEEVGAGS